MVLAIVAGACVGIAAVASAALASRMRNPPARNPWLWTAFVWPLVAVLSNVGPQRPESMSISTEGYPTDLFYVASALPRSLTMSLVLGSAAAAVGVSLVAQRWTSR